jgi:hypothetical protein
VPAGGSATVDVTISANAALADRSMYGGYIVLTPQGGGATYRVPYSGFKGDYQAIPVLVPTATNFPRMGSSLGGGSFTLRPDTHVYNLTAGDIPYVLVHLDHQSRRVRVDVTDAATGKSWHRALQLEYFGRNSTATGFFALPWDGTSVAGNKTYTAPAGQYRLTMTVTKALADESDPAHVETWSSPIITIARPAPVTP